MQEERDTDIVREERPSGTSEEGGRHHPQRAGEGKGDKDGGLVRDPEGTLWPETHQGKDEAYRDPVHLLRHPHGECGPSCPAGSHRNCPGRLMFHMWNGAFTGVSAPVVAGNEKNGSDTKPMI